MYIFIDICTDIYIYTYIYIYICIYIYIYTNPCCYNWSSDVRGGAYAPRISDQPSISAYSTCVRLFWHVAQIDGVNPRGLTAYVPPYIRRFHLRPSILAC